MMMKYIEDVFTYGQKEIAYNIENPPIYLIIFLCFLFYRVFLANRPAVIKDTKVIDITSSEHYSQVISKAKESGSVIVVDFYATWCPPCRAAAPQLAKLSLDYCRDSSKCIFLKVDVDKVPEPALANKVVSLPTFKIFKGDEEVDELIGWNENVLVSKLKRRLNSVDQPKDNAGVEAEKIKKS